MDNQDTVNTGNVATTEAPETQADWREVISDPVLRSNPVYERFKSVEEALKSIPEANKLIGKDKIPVPTDKDGKEMWDTVYSRLGRPESPKGYKLPEVKRPDGYPEADPKEVEGILTKAHELGLNNKQIGELYKSFMESEFSKYNQFSEGKQQSRLDAETQLRKEWGRSFEERAGKAERYINDNWSPEAIAKLKASGLNNDPDVIKAIYESASKISEDAIGGKSSGLSMSPDEAKSEIARIQGEAMGNNKHPLVNKEHPEHDLMVRKMETLFKFAHPETA